MRIDILTLFPGMFAGPLDDSIVRRAREGGFLDLRVHNLRDYARDKHKMVDDRPFGGGPGMLLKPEPLFEAVESIDPDRVGRVILTDPGGRRLDQSIVEELAKLDRMLLVCGSYEGYDERVREGLADDEISLGDFVLTNGALPAMVIVDAVTRLIPGVLGHAQSAVSESFNDELLDFPQYTRPAEFRGMRVPDVLLSGHHAEIENWRREQSLKRTLERRPDLFEKKKSDDQSGKSVN